MSILLHELFAYCLAPVLVAVTTAYLVGRSDGRRAEHKRACDRLRRATLFTRTKIPPFRRL